MWAEVVDVDLAVDLGRVELGAAFPQQRRLFALAFDQDAPVRGRPTAACACVLIDCCSFISLRRARLDGALRDLGASSKSKRLRAFFVGVAEDAEPVELRLADEVFRAAKSSAVSPGKPTMNEVRSAMPGTAARTFSRVLQEDVGARRRASCASAPRASVLQRHVEVLADVVVLRDGLEQAAGDLVGIGVEEAQPAQALDAAPGGRAAAARPSFNAEVFAVAGGVLADERDLAHAARDQLLRLGDDRLEPARAELAAQVAG